MNLRASTLLILAGSAALTACSTAPAQETRAPQAARELAHTLAGYTPGKPLNCIRSFRSTDMQIIDEWTILFKDGRTIYVQNPPGGCNGLGFGQYALVTRQFGPNQLCRGDINQLVDPRTGMGGGSCVFRTVRSIHQGELKLPGKLHYMVAGESQ